MTIKGGGGLAEREISAFLGWLVSLALTLALSLSDFSLQEDVQGLLSTDLNRLHSKLRLGSFPPSLASLVTPTTSTSGAR